MKVLKLKLASIMAAAAVSGKAVFFSSAAVPDRALLADIASAVDRTNDDDRHVHEILFLVSNAPGSITFLSRRITARLEAARTPAAALRPLLLLHCLLRAGDRYFEQDLRGLYSSGDLRIDAARCSSSSFLHGYTAYLHERIHWVINQSGNLEPITPRHHHQNDDGEKLLYKLATCQRLLDLAMHLQPDNNNNTSSRSAFAIVVRESFKVYDAFMEGVDVMMRSSAGGFSKSTRFSAHEIMRKACSQTTELKEFYQKCSSVSRIMEYRVLRVVTAAQASSLMELPAGEGVAEAAAISDGAKPFVMRKMETTISGVWVEFDVDDEQQQTGRREEPTGVEHDHRSPLTTMTVL